MGKKVWHKVTRTLQTADADRQRAMSGNVSSQLDESTLLLIRNGDEPVAEYIYGETDQLTRAGRQAGFEILPMEEDPELPEPVTTAAHPIIPWRSRLNKIGNMERLRTDVNELRRSVESLMPADSYVSIRLRHAGMLESVRIRDWVASEHNATEDASEMVRSGAMCARITVGAVDKKTAEDAAKAIGRAACPSMSDMSAHPSRPRLGLMVFSCLLSILWTMVVLFSPIPLIALSVPLCMLIVGMLGTLIIYVISNASLAPHVLASGFGVALVMLPGLFLTLPLWMIWPPYVLLGFAILRWLRRSLWGDIMQKPRRYWSVEPKRNARSADNENPLGLSDNKESVVAYPTQRSTMILSPMIILGLWTPSSDATAMSQEHHPVPEVLSKGGIYLGTDQTGRKGYLLPSQLYGGIAVVGEAGSGKSGLAHGIMQWADLARTTTDGQVWGEDSRIIDFEMKDDAGVEVMKRFRQKHWPDDKTKAGKVSYIADPKYRTIDLLGMKDGLDARATAQRIAASMKYSFNQGDIMNDSLDVITSAFTIGVAVARYDMEHPGEILEKARSMENRHGGAASLQPQISPVGWAVVALTASEGQTGSARAVGQVIRDLALEHGGDDLVEAAQAAEQLYGRPDQKGHVTISDQRLMDMTRASRNKVKQLLDVEHVFSPKRATITWKGVLDSPGDYHFVLAPHNGHKIPAPLDNILGAWMLNRLWQAITENCQGWQEQGRRAMIVCDELSLLAGVDDMTIAQIKNQGRSFGIIPVFATQYPEQLPDQLLRSFMGYSSFVSFCTPDTDTATRIAARLSDKQGEDGWTPGAVVNLRKFQAAVRARTEQQVQPSFLITVHNFDGKPL